MKKSITVILGMVLLPCIVAANEPFNVAVVDPFYGRGVLCPATTLRNAAGQPWVLKGTDCAQYLVDCPGGTGFVFDDEVNDIGECGFYSITMDSTGYVQVDSRRDCFSDEDGDGIFDAGDENPSNAKINECENDPDGNMDFSGHRYGRYDVCRADNNLTATDIHVGTPRTLGARAFYKAAGSIELKAPFRVFSGNEFSAEAGADGW